MPFAVSLEAVLASCSISVAGTLDGRIDFQTLTTRRIFRVRKGQELSFERLRQGDRVSVKPHPRCRMPLLSCDALPRPPPDVVSRSQKRYPPGRQGEDHAL
jgi:hypothetical protein